MLAQITQGRANRQMIAHKDQQGCRQKRLLDVASKRLCNHRRTA